jgi:integrase
MGFAGRLLGARHTSAMALLKAGVDMAVIALWLGHESIQTTHIYVEADLATSERPSAPIQGRRYIVASLSSL